ncbi:MucB/RseB C-terminal domain-containing protein [Thauera aromatica]|nr:MucB/RseB C-terminal domain-containing protein [Thauera aromatica]MCK2125526.1 MucB/RseB C-terminal domain-containing protein [Thauera aromatica]
MRFLPAVLCFCALLAGAPAYAKAPVDPLSWLGRVATAGQRLNYVGTFVYQSGAQVETSRIAHRVDADGEHERLEVLDGSPREIIRRGNEVRCVLPDERTVIIDEAAGGRRAFPARLPLSPMGLAENYRIRKGELGRIAGYEAQALVLEPRDDLRYGHVLWAEVKSGLLLKARMLDERGELIEQFAFSDVRIGGEVDSDLLKSRFAPGDGWRVVDARASGMPRNDSGWGLVETLPGYSLSSVMQRPLGRDRGQAVHMVFSDGLAAISVFIEPAGEGSAAGLGPVSTGAINIYKRTLGGHMITALGEAPERAVRRIGDSIQPVRQ